MQIKFYQLDAFTDTPFGGNPAGVVPLIPKPGKDEILPNLSEEQMRKIAGEINCSETAFILKPRDPRAHFSVRFFTPKEEVDLCGHATVAAFWLLAEEGYIPRKDPVKIVTQETKAGVLPVAVYFCEKGETDRIMMVQAQPEFKPCPVPPEELSHILGTAAENLTVPERPDAAPVIASTGLPDLLVPIKNRKALEELNPDMERLARISREHGFISIHAFTFDTIDPACTVHCRDFAPAVGINEESATGTASGALGAYLTAFRIIEIAVPTTRIICEQGYIMGRPSRIAVEIDILERKSEAPCGRFALGNIKVGGRAVRVIEGLLHI